MKIICVVQARLGSTRLLRKILAEIAGRPMLEHVLERAQAIEGITSVELALPWKDMDDEELNRRKWNCQLHAVEGDDSDWCGEYHKRPETEQDER